MVAKCIMLNGWKLYEYYNRDWEVLEFVGKMPGKGMWATLNFLVRYCEVGGSIFWTQMESCWTKRMVKKDRHGCPCGIPVRLQSWFLLHLVILEGSPYSELGCIAEHQESQDFSRLSELWRYQKEEALMGKTLALVTDQPKSVVRRPQLVN